MSFLEYSTILLPIFMFASVLIILYRHQCMKSIIPRNWPIVGMLPAVFWHFNQLHDRITMILAHIGGTFLFKGPSFAKMDMLFTLNPSNIHHIMSKNFTNYPRGEKFRELFDILGDGLTNIDGELWEFQHRVFTSIFKLPSFLSLSKNIAWYKVENELLPMLECISKLGACADLQEIFQRFSFDTICTVIYDYDPQSMSTEFPHIPCEKALSDIEEAIFYRQLTPPILWKLQQLLRIGNEKKLSNAWKTVDQFIYKYLALKQVEFNNKKNALQEENFKFLTTLSREFKDQSGTSGYSDKLLRDTILNMMLAGRDTISATLSWLFYLLGKNPLVEDKIREELQTKMETKMGMKWKDFIITESRNLVYLHGALSEVLRLFPAIPFQYKTPKHPDILPSGNQVDRNTTIILCYYSMGRMKSIWGDDCMEFKPERWVSAAGEIEHQPSYKFPAFNVGPRTCLGKEMSFSQMKIVAATIIRHYHVEVVEGHPVVPNDSIILKMKQGLKVRLTKRNEV